MSVRSPFPGAAGLNPRIGRGLLDSIPIAVLLAVELGFGAPTKGALTGGAFVCGFTAFDAPAGQRARWQAVTALILAIGAGIGILGSGSAVLAVITLALVGVAGGFLVAFSPWLASLGLLTCVAVLVAQGLLLPVSDVPWALLFVAAGGMVQAAWSLGIRLLFDRRPPIDGGLAGLDHASAVIREAFRSRSPAARHGLRLGLALGVGVIAYRATGFDQHGFWIPMTIVFAMKPDARATYSRLVMRAVGTAAGVLLATVVVATLDGSVVALIVVLTLFAGLAYGLLALQYALFTLAITTYIIALDDLTGTAPWQAMDERLIATAVGAVIAIAAFVLIPAPATRGPAVEAA